MLSLLRGERDHFELGESGRTSWRRGHLSWFLGGWGGCGNGADIPGNETAIANREAGKWGHTVLFNVVRAKVKLEEW